MAYYSAAILAIAASFLASASALELTTSNFDEITTGKTVFIKFYAPWCGHCKAMAADWARLENDFADHNIALVASVDCSEEENDSICEDFGVEVSNNIVACVVVCPTDRTHLMWLWFGIVLLIIICIYILCQQHQSIDQSKYTLTT